MVDAGGTGTLSMPASLNRERRSTALKKDDEDEDDEDAEAAASALGVGAREGNADDVAFECAGEPGSVTDSRGGRDP